MLMLKSCPWLFKQNSCWLVNLILRTFKFHYSLKIWSFLFKIFNLLALLRFIEMKVDPDLVRNNVK